MRWLALLFVVALLSGCADDKETPESASPISSGDGDLPEQGDPEPAPQPEVPEEAGQGDVETEEGESGHLTINLTGDAEAGGPPLQVNFTITGEAINQNNETTTVDWTWTLVRDDGVSLGEGDTLPATVPALFQETGTFVVTATITAPGFGSASQNFTIFVDPALRGPPGPGEGVERDHTCHIDVGASGTTFNGDILGTSTNVGSCNLIETAVLAVAAAISAPSGCSVNAAIEKAYDPGTLFKASCGPGTANVDPSIRLRTWE